MTKTLKRTEHAEQCVVIEWATYNTTRWPQLRTLYAIPNGGKRERSVAAKLQAEGVKPGVSDLCLPVSRNGKHGLYIEMKVKPNKPTEEQLCWLADLDSFGYRAVVCYSADEAIAEITQYLGDAK